MAHHLYMEQRNSYSFDKVLELAQQYGIYFKIVILEKNEWIFNHIDYQGVPIPFNPLCSDTDASNDPENCPGNQWFYGNGRQMTKARWLQQAWWRYLQARWGYSTNIHSWELLNEGDPFSGLHYTMADVFGKLMHHFIPDDHLVTTSFWHSFPKEEFWANPNYPNIDYADVHLYIGEDSQAFYDTSQATVGLSMELGANQPGGSGKPLMRGETGFVLSDSQPATRMFEQDNGGIWLHNFIWAGINVGGMIESYWYETQHIYQKTAQGKVRFDYRYQYGIYYNFIKDIPLNNGDYTDAFPEVTSENLRVWGQKDLNNGQAHLWIQNKNHTWKNVVDGVYIAPVSGMVTLRGFKAGDLYTVQWWDTYQPDPTKQIIRIENVSVQPDGSIVLRIDNLTTDLACKLAKN